MHTFLKIPDDKHNWYFNVKFGLQNFQWELGCISLFASWLNLIAQHPILYVYVYIITTVILKLKVFTLVFILFILMFGFLFSALLPNQVCRKKGMHTIPT